MSVLAVENLRMYYATLRGYVHAVEDVSFSLERGKALGLAGESGCGKTSVALSILRLLPDNGEILGGRIFLEGQNILEMSDKRFRKDVRWMKLSVIFQGAMNCLHPVIKIGDQISEAILLHEKVSKEEALEKALGL